MAEERVITKFIADITAYITGTRQIESADKRIESQRRRTADATRSLEQLEASSAQRRIRLINEIQRAEAAATNQVLAAKERLKNASAQELVAAQKSRDAALANQAVVKARGAERLGEFDLITSQRLENATIRNTRALSDLRAMGVSATGALGGLNNAKVALSNSAHSLNRALSSVGTGLVAMTGFGNRAAVALRFGAQAAVLFTGALTLREASNFQTQLTLIDNLTELTTEDTQRLGKEILNLTKTMPQSPSELGAGAYKILSSGISDAKTGLDVLEISAKASAVSLGTVKDVSTVLTAVVLAYGKENIDAAQAADILGAAAKAGAADANSFASEIGRLLGIAPKLGIEFNELAAAVAALTNVGLPAHQAVTAILGIMNQLISPSTSARDALLGVGSSIEEIQQTVSDKGFVEALRQVIVLFGGQASELEKLLPDVRGYSGALNLAANDSAIFGKALATTNKSVGFIDDAFTRVSKTFAFQANLLKNDLNRAIIELGTRALPFLTEKVKELREFLDRNKESIIAFIERGIKLAIAIVGSFARGLIAIINGLNDTNKAIKSITGVSPAAIAAIAAIGLAFAWALPGGPVIIGLMAIVAAIGEMQRLSKGEGPLANARGPKWLRDINATFEGNVLKPLGLKTPELDARKREQEALDKTTDSLEKTSEATETFAEQQLKKLLASFQNTGTEALEAAKKLKVLEDGIIDFSEATKLGITAQQAGAVEAVHAIIEEQRKAKEEAFNFAKAVTRVAVAFRDGAEAAGKATVAIGKEALSKLQAAQQALFGTPTQEVAQLELQLAQLQLQRAGTREGAGASRLDTQIEQVTRRLGLLSAETEVFQKAIQAANKTAPTQAERNTAAQQLIQDTLLVSTATRTVADRFNINLIPELDLAREAVFNFTGAIITLANDEIRGKLIPQGFDPLIARMQLLDENTDAVIKNFGRLAEVTKPSPTSAGSEGGEDTPKLFIDRIKNISKGIRDGFISELDGKVIAAKFVEDFLTKTEENLEIQSPSRVMAEIGAKTMQGYGQGVNIGFGSYVDPVLDNILKIFQQEGKLEGEALTEALRKAIVAGVPKVQAGLNTIIKTIRDSASEFKKAADEIAAKFGSITSGNYGNKPGTTTGSNSSSSSTSSPTSTGNGDTAAQTATGSAGGMIPGALHQLATAANTIAASPLFNPDITKPIKFSSGGVVTRPTFGMFGESGIEAILPLTKPARAREIMGSISPALLANIMPRGGGYSGPNINVSVTGNTSQEMEMIAIGAVKQAFRDARFRAINSGSSLSIGVG